MEFSHMDTPLFDNKFDVDSPRLTPNQRLFNVMRKKSKRRKPFTEEDKIKEIKACLSDGADIDAVDVNDKSNTLSHTAVLSDNKKVLKFLIDKNADISIRNNDKKTPLDIAREQNNSVIINILEGQFGNSNASTQYNSKAEDKRQKGTDDGRLYEKLVIDLFAARGYECLKDEKANLFAIGREVSAGNEHKFDDTIFMYHDQNNAKNIISVQVKHIQNKHQINSEILSSDASINEHSSIGGMKKNFNLQKYLISYLEARENFKVTKSEVLKDGKIRYLVLFTNVGLDIEELKNKGFVFKKAPDDIINLLNVRKSSDHYQLENISKDLREKLEKRSSDLYRLAYKLAQYVIDKRMHNKVMEMKPPVQHYHAVLEKEVIETEKNDKGKNIIFGVSKKYCKGKFRHEFRNNEFKGPKLNLRNAIFEAIRKMDKSKENATNDELKKDLEAIELKLHPSFGRNKKEPKTVLPEKLTGKAEDIDDFLKHLVLIVNQPCAEDFEQYVNNIIKNIVLRETLLKHVLKQMENVSEDVRKRIENMLQMNTYGEKWTHERKIQNIFQDIKQPVNASYLISILAILYEWDIMKLGVFNVLGLLTDALDKFLLDLEQQILFIYTPETFLSSVKIQQYFSNKKNYRAEDGRISVNLKDLIDKAYRNILEEAFKLEVNKLLIIECTGADQDMHRNLVNNLFRELFAIIKYNHEKKIILVIQEKKTDILSEKFLPEKFMSEYQNTIKYSSKTDLINIDDFNPDGDPLTKEVILFQEQERKISFVTLTGISDWNTFLELSKKGDNLLDIQTFVKLLKNDEIKIGSKPLKMCNLEGSYAKLFEEIHIETFRGKILSKRSDNISDDYYIISGLEGSDNEKLDKLLQHLKVAYNQEVEKKVGDIASGYKIQIAKSQFQEKDFLQLCHNCSNKRLFWIILKNEGTKGKFILREIYNPDFYRERKFKKINEVFIRKDIKHLFNKRNLSDTFIFSGINNQEEFIQLFTLGNHSEEQYIRNHFDSGKIRLSTSEVHAAGVFEKVCQEIRTPKIHWLKWEDKKLIWYKSRGPLGNLRNYIDEEKGRKIIKEKEFIHYIKDKRLVIIADDPGMGKSTTLTKLYESKVISESFLDSHWIIRINLREHIQAIKDVDFKNVDINTVTEFLMKVDLSLNHRFTEKLLKIALNKNETSSIKFSKPLLIAFDGFDEVLDEADRSKIISLFEFLKTETRVKFWITTRQHFKHALEDELIHFAIEFDPMDEEEKRKFIKKYYKTRMNLLLSEHSFKEVFRDSDRLKGPSKIEKYTVEFLNKMNSVFQSSTHRFLGTPLQLYLMLEGSLSNFRSWLEKCDYQCLNFDYLGRNVWEVYERFVERKYDIYFQKTGINEQLRQKHDKIILNKYHRDLALSSIRNLEPEAFFSEFEDIVLSIGLVRKIFTESEDINFEFIHHTFKEYFAAQLFIHWIEKSANDLANSNKQEYLLKEILMKSIYKLIRTFMDIKLNEGRKIPIKKLKQFGEIINNLWGQQLQYREGTILHTTIDEENKHILEFIFDCLENTVDFHKIFVHFLNIKKESDANVFFKAIYTSNDEIFHLVLNKIEENIKECKLRSFLSDNKDLIFELYSELSVRRKLKIDSTSALERSWHEHILVLLDLVKNNFSEKELREFFGRTVLYTTVIKNNTDEISTLLEKDSLKSDLSSTDKLGRTVLHYAVENSNYEVTNIILNKAKTSLSEEELKSFLDARDFKSESVFHIAVENLNFEITELLLKTTNCSYYGFPGKCDYLNYYDSEERLRSLIPGDRRSFYDMLHEEDDTHTYVAHLFGAEHLRKSNSETILIRRIRKACKEKDQNW